MDSVPSKRFIVYTLAWPAVIVRPSSSVFYVGKGNHKRPEQHLFEARNPDCYCKKCRTIRIIWAMGHEVAINVVYETDDEREALRHEKKLIEELSSQVRLCNKSNNPQAHCYNANRPSIPIHEMSYESYVSYLKTCKHSRKEREQMQQEWAARRLAVLEPALHKARRYKWTEEIAELENEIECLRMQTGLVLQMMIFDL